MVVVVEGSRIQGREGDQHGNLLELELDRILRAQAGEDVEDR